MSLSLSAPDRQLWRTAFAAEDVLLDEAARAYVLQDFSWYSPLLSAQLQNVSVDVIVFPRSLDQLEFAISAAVRLGSPITLRGAGTGNYGQSVPVHGGILVDMRHYAGVTALSATTATVRAGTRIAVAEETIREQGRELHLMPTSYRKSQTAGFVAGGAGGLGSITYGMLWDRNVVSAEVLTIEATPRRIHIGPDDIDVLIHTYGTVAAMADIELPVAPARSWVELGVAFASFEHAAAFCWAFGRMTHIPKRLLSMESAPIPSFFPVRHLYAPGDSIALLVVEDGRQAEVQAIAEAHAGRVFAWPRTPEISQFAFAHSPLWAKHADPSLSWIQLQWSTDEQEFGRQVAAVKRRIGEKDIYLGFTFTRRGGTTLSVGSVGLLPRATAASIEAAMGVCRSEGVFVKNPHTYVLEDGGQVNNIDRIVAWKRRLDPHNLLNPGKLRSAA
ncbi:MAG TPA: FAD-binding oxidoreductase [Chloroflexota bacterium]|nr:FAD-binding oxidoreductase [Chloroflexota bacterium]